MVNIKLVKKMKKYIIFVAILALILSFILGLYLYKLNRENEKIAFEAKYGEEQVENILKEAENLIQETSKNKNITTPNTKIIEKKYYKDCDHLVEEENKINTNLVNKDESEIQTQYIGWEIQKFSQNEVVVYKEVNDFCDEHYLLKDVEGEIIVYRLDKYNTPKEVMQETGIQTKYLSEIDMENLKEGIKVCGKENLSLQLEDFE